MHPRVWSRQLQIELAAGHRAELSSNETIEIRPPEKKCELLGPQPRPDKMHRMLSLQADFPLLAWVGRGR